MRVFLTGGTGYLGGHVARELLGAGHEVVALVRDLKAAVGLAGAGARLHRGELIEPAGWERVLATCDGVVHVAALVEAWGVPSEMFDRVNRTATLDLLERVRPPMRCVVTSSVFALGPSEDGAAVGEEAVDRAPHPVSAANDYVRSKTAMTQEVRRRQREGGERAMMVFPTVLLGPGALTRGNHTARVLDDIGRGRFPGVVGDGEQVWNLVSVDAAARGHVLALEKGAEGTNYILGGENWTQKQLVERAAALFGRQAPTRRLGLWLPKTAARLSVAWARLTGRRPLVTPGEVRLYDAHWSVRSDRARGELGYSPEPVQATLESTITWLREEIWARR